MRIFNALLVIIAAALLFLLPVADAIYDFRTNQRTDSFAVATLGANTTATVQLLKTLYDSDLSTISFSSNSTTDNPLATSYNASNNALVVSQLTTNTNRLLAVSYDVDAIGASAAINTILNNIPFVWMLLIIAFPVAAVYAIFTGRIDKYV